jgi:hypothetical protein
LFAGPWRKVIVAGLLLLALDNWENGIALTAFGSPIQLIVAGRPVYTVVGHFVNATPAKLTWAKHAQVARRGFKRYIPKNGKEMV